MSTKPTGSEVRSMFLRFFEQKGHKIVHSSSLVPHNDPTLLFTNAGMNQFKDVFLGIEKRDYKRATTSQKCVRAGGKHNDLENVGFTNRHHTFFEMLGNFSFGDYFKKDAIAYAWELVTSPHWFGIDPKKLYATIFEGRGDIPRDDEAEKYWLDVGVPKERIFAMGMKDNFWQMGDTGPCGPCSEIHYDMGVAASEAGHTDCHFPCDCGRYVEIWNLVFMQYDKQPGGELVSLPKPSIDTGAGLERVTAVLQGVISNYETDLFVPLIKRAAELTVGQLGDASSAKGASAASMRIIADHSRCATFLISDGVIPSNEGRGYVLRKILRRAITHGRLLGQTKPFLQGMVFTVRDLMKDAYPELNESADRVSKVVLAEEKRFAHTLELGWARLEEEIAHLRKAAEGLQDMTHPSVHKPEALVLSGETAFKLYDTFGLQRDFIRDACRDQEIVFDEEGFDRAMEAQRERARASWKGGAKATASPIYQEIRDRFVTAPHPTSATGLPMVRPIFTEFVGYKTTFAHGCAVLAIVKDNHGAQQLKAGERGEVVLDHTPFYAESGGQVGDVGSLYADDHNTLVADVEGVSYPVQGVRAHRVVA
jgi:alanyl-tRNA synthetase